MILGIDPSLTGLAIVKGPNIENWSLERFTSAPLGHRVRDRIIRYENLIAAAMDWIGDAKVSAVFIEGYSMGSKGQALTGLAELGGLLRWHLDGLTENIHEVAPTTLKKFATGSGKGSKSVIGAHLAKRYGLLFASDDAYDAWGLFAMGLVSQGIIEPANKAQAEAVAVATAPPKVKTKKAK